MKKNYILHIGLPKTGTTALQKYYFSQLQNPSICYNPLPIVHPLVEAIKLLDFELLKKEDIALLNDVIQFQSSKIQQNNIFISREILSQRLMKFNFIRRGDFLKSIFPDATVVLVLRHQPTLLRSLYQQQVLQRYILQPEEVFIPFAECTFLPTEHWKTAMQIDVKKWDYKETIKHFRYHYGEKFHVLFFENHSKNIIEIGRNILEYAGFHVNKEDMDRTLPNVNVSYDSAAMHMFLSISRRQWALNSFSGFNSPRIQNLMEQAHRARYIFDATSVEDFLNRMENKLHRPNTTYSTFDKQLIKAIKKYRKLRKHFIKPQRYELPDPIKFYLEHESKSLNASLIEVIDKQEIPKQYL